MDALATLAKSKMFVECGRYLVVTELCEVSAESHLQ